MVSRVIVQVFFGPISGTGVLPGLAHFTTGHESPILRLGMSNVIVTGKAQDDRETFVFTVEPFVSGGFLPSIRYAGDGEGNVTGAKAKQIAEETAGKLLHGAVVNWQD
jgi:hypothetical protein